MKKSLPVQLIERFAFFISALSSPYLVLVACSLLVIDKFSHTQDDFLVRSSLFVTYASLIPLLFVYAGVRSGSITDIHVMLKEQRTSPIVVGLVSSAFLSLLYYVIGVPKEILAMCVSMVVCGVALLAITNYWKISIHAGSLTGSITLVGILVSPVYLYALLALPLVIWARTSRGRHSFMQTVAGALLGAVCSLSVCASLGLI